MDNTTDGLIYCMVILISFILETGGTICYQDINKDGYTTRKYLKCKYGCCVRNNRTVCCITTGTSSIFGFVFVGIVLVLITAAVVCACFQKSKTFSFGNSRRGMFSGIPGFGFRSRTPAQSLFGTYPRQQMPVQRGYGQPMNIPLQYPPPYSPVPQYYGPPMPPPYSPPMPQPNGLNFPQLDNPPMPHPNNSIMPEPDNPSESQVNYPPTSQPKYQVMPQPSYPSLSQPNGPIMLQPINPHKPKSNSPPMPQPINVPVQQPGNPSIGQPSYRPQSNNPPPT